MLPPGGCNINLYSVVYDAMLHFYNIGFVGQWASSFTCSVNLMLSHTDSMLIHVPLAVWQEGVHPLFASHGFLLLLSFTVEAGKFFPFLC